MGDAYLFVFKVEVVDAFDFTMPSDSLSAEPHHGEHREHRESRGIEHRPQTQKSLPLAGFCFFYSISSGYHMGRIKPPNIFEGIKV
jgi:hypothetical protein